MSPYTIIVCVSAVAVADFVLWRVHLPYLVEALFDEPAHAATGLLALLAISVAPAVSVVLAVIGGPVLIDLDHLPHVFGSSIFDCGVPRPYPHALMTLLVIAAAALIRDRRRRAIAMVVAAAVAVHLLRDMAEPAGGGVALFWPLSDHGYAISYASYGIALLILAAIGLVRRRGATTPATVNDPGPPHPPRAGARRPESQTE